MELQERLAAYVRLFGQRPDLHLWRSEWGTPASIPELPESAGFLSRATLRFAWSFEPPYGEKPQGDGGHLFLSACHDRGWEGPDGRWLAGASSSLLVDMMVEEGIGLLVVDEGHELAQGQMAFYDANDDRLIRLGSLEQYLTLGARRGFAWYWQNDENFQWLDLVARLHASSLGSGSTEEALVSALTSRGASELEARALVAWLGDDVRILIPRES
ncbi:MAG: hypothetical protein IPK80_34545 [Nannocystis sp.]|nr:hypothetical protein [Nannocystis sp.]